MSLTVSSEIYTEQCLNVNEIKLDIINSEVDPRNNGVLLDEDGDLVVQRKKISQITLDVERKTKIAEVGLQLWRGAFLLADYLISEQAHLLKDKTVLELGAGVGLTSIIASMFAKKVISTDISKYGILERLRDNFSKNKDLILSHVSIKELDFLNHSSWSSSLKEEINNADIVIAADVIYDNDLTEAFADTLAEILRSSKKTALIALEKRFVFTIDDLDTVAPCYEHFLAYLKESWNKQPMSTWEIETIPIDFKQYFNYDRNKHLVLWKIQS